MLVIDLLAWWYTTGWLELMTRGANHVTGALRFFSVAELAGSLFAPYRQVSAGRVQGPLGVRLRAWSDRVFSRIIGFIVRMLLIIVGLLTFLIMDLVYLVAALVWPIIPLMPIAVPLLVLGGLI